jgi:hypothetical protein
MMPVLSYTAARPSRVKTAGRAPSRSASGRFGLVLTGALLLTACGGGGGGGGGGSVDSGSTAEPAPPATVGQVALFLTDRPADLDELAGFQVSFSQAALVTAAGQSVPLLEVPRQFDLLRLRAEQIPIAIGDIPAGVRFETLRLQVEGVELSFKDGRPARRLPIEPVLELPLEQALIAGEGEIRYLQVDWDVAKSLQVEGEDYTVRPVTTLDVEGAAFEAKLARLMGVIDAIDARAGEVRVCGVVASEAAAARHVSTCLRLRTTPGTSLFDAFGRQRPASDLFGDSRLLGERVKVWARSRLVVDAPVGDPRIFEALVVQLGDPIELTGTVELGATGLPGVFVMTLDPGQLPGPRTGFRVALGVGTKILDEGGGAAETDDISARFGPKRVRVQGIPLKWGRDDFNAAMIFVSDEDDPDDSTMGDEGDRDWLRGVIQQRRGSHLMVVAVHRMRCDDKDGPVAGDLFVSLQSKVRVRRLSVAAGKVVSRLADTRDLDPGRFIEAFGSCRPGKAPFQADDVLIFSGWSSGWH